ncbi:MAG: hypothetical protein PWP74_974 [Shewanella sp.]|uniref:cytoplasmic protein n=1 Tax=Shewanella TaxID=22 RepID=UPI001679F596|nr:cytoplasmic protein [Shewanella fodinae]MCD8475450.1 cytoplasmic protein [Shewanella fodinae]MCL2907922.1 cytoplasmic protein [Shewanella fodinae]MDN5369666.1 hypothetical protein [Shewanella sp.]GGZ11653.1 hypothetical protein GCM10007169_30310 [Shewanella fodinae]
MAGSINSQPIAGDVQLTIAVKVAQLAKQQQQAQGQVALQLIEAATPPQANAAATTDGPIGSIINTTA